MGRSTIIKQGTYTFSFFLFFCFVGIVALFTLFMGVESQLLQVRAEHMLVLKKRYDEAMYPADQGEFDLECGSDDTPSVSNDTLDFVVVNRSPNYLKESTYAYFKDENLEKLTSFLKDDDWESYSDVVLSHEEKKQRARHKKVARRPRKKQNSVSKRPIKTTNQFAWPLKKSVFWLSSFFGPRKKQNGVWGFHYGIDMAALRGTPVHAAGNGVVTEARYVSGYGNMVIITHDARYKTRYAHLDSIRVRQGMRVKTGDVVGTVGDTGFTIKSGKDASHLHFEVCERGKQVNPLRHLPRY